MDCFFALTYKIQMREKLRQIVGYSLSGVNDYSNGDAYR